MSQSLVDPLGHNAWATAQLLEFCQRLSPEQLQATVPGTYGTILATWQHILRAEGGYRYRLSGDMPAWRATVEETDDLDELARIAADLAAFWEDLVARPFDSERTIVSSPSINPTDTEDWEVKAGILVAQTINHGNEHRSQINTILTTLDFEPPELGAWEYGEATGRFRFTETGKP